MSYFLPGPMGPWLGGGMVSESIPAGLEGAEPEGAPAGLAGADGAGLAFSKAMS